MTIIVEGLDRCGKDTQIQKLDDYFLQQGIPVTIGHARKITTSDVEQTSRLYYGNMIANFETPENEVKIWNRAHLGEAVYSPIYRKYSGDYVFSYEQMHNATEGAWKDVFLLVFIDYPGALVKREDGNSFSSTVEGKQMEIDAFTRAFKCSCIPNKCLINIGEIGDADKVFKYIIDYIDNSRSH